MFIDIKDGQSSVLSAKDQRIPCLKFFLQSLAPNFFRNAFFIIVLYRETKNWFKKLGTRK